MDGVFDAIIKILELLFSNIFVIFFLLLFVLPMLARRGRHADLIQLFSRIQKKRKSRIITLVHRLEPMGFLGIPQFGYIDLNDAEEVVNAIRSTPADKPLEIMLHTPGGLVLAALQIARAVKAHPGPTKVYIPQFAMSGGTMIALAADEIVMTDHAIMGPIDPQIDGLPAASIIRVAESKDPNATSDWTLVLADMSRMAIREVTDAARELLHGNVSESQANHIAELLATGTWNHDYPIYAHAAKELGLNVSTDMPDDFMELMAAFPNTLSNRSGATFLPEAVTALFGRGNQKQAHTAHPMQAPNMMPGSKLDEGMISGRSVRQVSFGPWNPSELEARGQSVPHRLKGHKYKG